MPYGLEPLEYEQLLEERNREVGEWYRKSAKRDHEPKITSRVLQSAPKGPTRETKLLESETISRKEETKMSEKPYYIGTLLPEAKKAYFALMETNPNAIVRVPKKVGSLLPEAKGAYEELIGNG